VKTIYRYCFLSRQTWLRGPHAAPTIEDYWPKFFYRVQLGSGRMHPSVHVRTYQLVRYLGPRTGCNRPLLYCEDEYVRACTLYVGQQVCAYLHPVRGIVSVSHLFTKLADYWHAPCTWHAPYVQGAIVRYSTVRTSMCVHAPCTWDNKCVRICTLYVADRYFVPRTSRPRGVVQL
jgi:hypothetical protein